MSTDFTRPGSWIGTWLVRADGSARRVTDIQTNATTTVHFDVLHAGATHKGFATYSESGPRWRKWAAGHGGEYPVRVATPEEAALANAGDVEGLRKLLKGTNNAPE